MDYENLVKKIRRYSLVDLVNYCCYRSSFFMQNLENKPSEYTAWPWVIDALAVLSVRYAGENPLQNGFDKNTFDSMYKAIMDHVPLFFGQLSDKFSALDMFYISDFGIQKRSRNHKQKMLRHSLLFSYDSFADKYRDKFHYDYYEYLQLAFYFTFSYEFLRTLRNKQDVDGLIKIIEYTYKKFLPLISKAKLSITRQTFIEEYKKLNVPDDDIKYCFNILWWYPFVEIGSDVLIPCPYHIIDAVTTSFVCKITDGNEENRKLFGEALEKYVYEVVANSEQFENVIPDFIYGDSQKSSDAIARVGNEYVFFESKAFTPSFKAFLGDETMIEKSIKRIAEAVVQLYKSSFEKFQVEYWFNQEDHEEKVPLENKWGIVVVNEDIFVNRELIYKKAIKLLKLSTDSPQYKIMCERIAISDINEFEKCCIYGESLLQKLKDRFKKRDLYSLFQYDEKRKSEKYSNNKNYIMLGELINKLKENHRSYLCELNQAGLLPK